MKPFVLKYLLVVLLSSSILLLFLYSPKAITTNQKTQFAFLQLTVLNNLDGSFINNATICITNCYDYYVTNKFGKTPTIKIPLFVNCKNDDYYLITLLCYKAGYNDYIYFNLKLKPNQKRTDVVIKLEEIINEAKSPTIYFEEPARCQIEKIINEYKKIGKKFLPIYFNLFCFNKSNCSICLFV